MSMQVIPFSFESFQIRVVMVNGEPWWVAADVCAVLEIGNSSDAIRRLDDDERTLVSIEGASNGLPVNVVNEPGLYSLILGSRKPEAKKFKRWVTHDVLPTIRQTGGYGAALKAPEPSVAVLADSPYPRLHDQLNKALTLLTRPTSRVIQQVAFAQAQQLCGQLGITMEAESLPESFGQKYGKPTVDDQVMTFLERRKKYGANIHDLTSLCWGFRKLHKLDRDALLQRLLDQGRAVMVTVSRKHSSGRHPAVMFVAAQFAEMAA